VCIVGAGAAGIALARELAGGRLSVALLESGGFEWDSETQALYQGESAGHPYFPLTACRLRYFGGTTNHWAGYCRPLDAQDFEPRAWVPGSGWPISRVELDPYYRRAQSILQLGPYRYDAAFWQALAPDPPLALEPEVLFSRVFQLSPPTRLGSAYRDEIVAAPGVNLILHANLTGFELTPGGDRVLSARAATLSGNELRVEAQIFVLATGGIENARLLLASRSPAHPDGLGNRHDLVGRYFMEHPHLVAGFFVPSGAGSGTSFYAPQPSERGRFSGVITARDEVLERERINRFSITLLPAKRKPDAYLEAENSQGVVSLRHLVRRARQQRLPDDLAGHVWRVIRDLDDVAVAAYGRAAEIGSEDWMYQLFFRTEQTPNPASRVTLSGEKDALGVPRVRLDWQILEQDLRTIRRGHELFGLEVGRAGLGRLFFPDEDAEPTWIEDLFGGNHHMGTTRMHPDPRQGVVAADCRLHGVANLYVAGSSVFPTTGFANPTLTIVALTLRLADRIRAVAR